MGLSRSHNPTKTLFWRKERSREFKFHFRFYPLLSQNYQVHTRESEIFPFEEDPGTSPFLPLEKQSLSVTIVPASSAEFASFRKERERDPSYFHIAPPHFVGSITQTHPHETRISASPYLEMALGHYPLI